MAHFSSNTKGALLMIAAMTAFTCNDATIKTIGGNANFFQIIGIRGIMASLLLAMLALSFGQMRPKLLPRAKRLLFLRSGADVIATFCYLYALFNMPLSIVVAILQILPLSVVFAGALFLKEPIGWKSSIAILIGFLGAMLVIKPTTGSYDPTPMLAVILAVIAVTARDLLARQMPQEAPSLFIAFVNALAVAFFSLIASAFSPWEALPPQGFQTLALSAFFLAGAYFFSVTAMRVGALDAVTPFRYSSLLVALILGYLIFNERPDFWTWVGVALMVAGGCFALWRKSYKEKITQTHTHNEST